MPKHGLKWRDFGLQKIFLLSECMRRSFSQTSVEKIVQRYVTGLEKGHGVHQGDYVRIKPKYLMTHDNTSSVIKKFEEIGVEKMYNKKQMIFTLDHDIQNTREENLRKYELIKQFAERHGIDFFPAGRGIGHQILIEEGYAYPGLLVVASDSHSNIYGGVGCLGTPVVRTDAASIWATGETWWQIPHVVKVELLNELRPGVTGKDLIITLCGKFCKDEVLNTAIEFHGSEGISKITIEDRLAIANMTTEWGAVAGLFPVDDVTISWLEKRVQSSKGKHHTRENLDTLLKNIVYPDNDAVYSKHLAIDLSTISQVVSGPNSVKISTPISELEDKRIKIDKAYLVSCVNSRASDLKAAANVLNNRKIAKHVEMYVAPASSLVREEAEASGDWDIFVKSGAKILPSGCGPCIGLGTGLLRDGEVGISATNRNFKGRMGSPLASAYLASPAVVAASAVKGYIISPDSLDGTPARSVPKVVTRIAETDQLVKPPVKSCTISNFPGNIFGNILFLDTDNLNTDGIYPGKYTYQDDISRDTMSKVIMENYDPKFAQNVQKDDVIVSGYNFGTGSSREQAAIAFLCAGVRLIIAGSFNDIYRRNAINNGLIVIEIPKLIEDIRMSLKSNKISSGSNHLTIRVGWKARAFLTEGRIVVFTNQYQSNSSTYYFSPIGKIAQELVVAGGLVPWARNQITRER